MTYKVSSGTLNLCSLTHPGMSQSVCHVALHGFAVQLTEVLFGLETSRGHKNIVLDGSPDKAFATCYYCSQ